ncbi:hypothetical protein EHO61_09730 [Leptospira fluminis]|uniref:Uncharacterized protein n=1 Tax=Leptospira fluminis TaxID=2484979 RepID=A0A4R9GPM6_9LEPT|nr:hypothetical protein [Leptospira fluminis]TGK18728.1 hypothetical protein EHO61_09730 [Leptospira fluminis]
MFLLAQDLDSPILKWPEFSWIPVLNGALFVLALVTAIYYIQKYLANRNVSQRQYRDRILAKLNVHEFSPRNVSLIHSFLDKIPYPSMKGIVEDPSWYRKYFLPEFLQFLADQGNLPAWKDVQIVRSLDHAIQNHQAQTAHFIPAVLQADSEERFSILLRIDQIDSELVGRSIHARVYSKKGTHPFSLKRYEKVHIFYLDENKRWLRAEAVFISQEGGNLTLQIESAPEVDAQKSTEWAEGPKPNIFQNSEVPGGKDEYTDSLDQILSYASVDSGVRSEVEYAIRIFKEHPGTTRRPASREDLRIFIHIYKVCYLKSRTKAEEVPKPVRLFLNFFYLDEKLVSRKRILELENCLSLFKSLRSEPRRIEANLSLHTLSDWLALVLAGKRNPSRNHLGEFYDRKQRTENVRLTEPRGADRLKEAEYLSDVLDWELENLLFRGLFSISLNPDMIHPFLSEDLFYGDTKGNLLFYDKIFDFAEKVQKIDPGLFYKKNRIPAAESSPRISNIVKESYADCILLPFSGNRGALWQEISDGNSIYGRILLPSILSENASLTLAKAFGEFRWETERILHGNRWKDPISRSLTSEYYSYLEGFRKNPNLTLEAKKRVEQQWLKAGKNIKDMFSLDYAYWVLMESQGKPRLNRLVRDILARFVPSHKPAGS